MGILQIPQNQLHIHPRAVMIREHYIAQEKENGLLKIGSTNQGVGVARREKLMRADDITFAKDVGELSRYITDTVDFINAGMEDGDTVLCEMTQGFDLCLEHGIDPHYCTSKMVNPSMAMAEAGVSPHLLGDVYGVFRPYPIRVNNRAGSSGPYAEAKEITWDEVARRSGTTDNIAEITTTTKLPRRVFEFSKERFTKFIRICAPTHLCLQFANYVDVEMFKAKKEHEITRPLGQFIEYIEKIAETPVSYIGTGPGHEDMIDCGLDTLALD
jgi:adenylosuccinate synthase